MAKHESAYTKDTILPFLEAMFPDSWWLKVVASPAQRNGIPDLVGCYDGRFIGLEVKNPLNDRILTRLQRQNLREIRSAGGVAMVVRDTIEIERLLTPWNEFPPQYRATFLADVEPQNLEEL